VLVASALISYYKDLKVFCSCGRKNHRVITANHYSSADAEVTDQNQFYQPNLDLFTAFIEEINRGSRLLVFNWLLISFFLSFS